jgi:hypothetical protein
MQTQENNRKHGSREHSQRPDREAVRAMGAALKWACLGALCLTFSAAGAALDPTQPPGGNFDLSHWKLTLPDASASDISAAQLTSGYTNSSFFYTGPDGAMVFWCPVNGGVTSGSTYPRSELRELITPPLENVDWTGYGTHILTAQCKVTQVPSTQKVIIGQVHSFTGKAVPLVKLQYFGGKIQAVVALSPTVNTNTVLDLGSVALGDLIAYQLQMVDGVVSVTANGNTQSLDLFALDAAWTNQTFYFKAGSYCQDNVGDATEGALVAFYQLGAQHQIHVVTPPSPLITSFTRDPVAGVHLSLSGEGGGSYFIQASTNLIDWGYVLITNSLSGYIDFTEPASEAMPVRFYRAGRL